MRLQGLGRGWTWKYKQGTCVIPLGAGKGLVAMLPGAGRVRHNTRQDVMFGEVVLGSHM